MDMIIKELIRRPNIEDMLVTKGWFMRDIQLSKCKLYIEYLESLIKQIPEDTEIPGELEHLRIKLIEWSKSK